MKTVIPKGFFFESLTRWSYFPTQKREPEFVPSLNTEKFTPEVALELGKLKLRKGGYDQLEYRLTRHNLATRPLSIPHPHAYADLCLTLESNIDKILETVDIYNNPNSLIKPARNSSGRLIVMDYGDPLINSSRLVTHSFGKRFRVQTDITNCYSSIYTHALPWALMGLEHSKANLQKEHWFNQIDASFRNIKRNETQGIGIGPAVSNIAAEIILGRIDLTLSNKYDYHRYIDDYTCYCRTHEEALKFIADLDSALRSYKMTLNVSKTRIDPLPACVSSEWVLELQSRAPLGSFTNHLNEVSFIRHSSIAAIKYLELAIHLNQKSPDGSIIKFAVKSILDQLQPDGNNVVTQYILNLSFIYPHLLPLLDAVIDSDSDGVEAYEKHLTEIAIEHCKSKRSDGICWPLYYLHKLSLKVSPLLRDAVLASEDCTALLLLETFPEHYGATEAFVKSLQSASDYDQDKYWLLTYQMLRWNRYKGIKSSDAFDLMKHLEVSFSNIDNTPSASELKLQAKKDEEVAEYFECLFDELDAGNSNNDT
ncbi:antiviral reverse transcriptase Drt4 [Pseudomonas sp. SLFW]|uniref:antiviral reverse transcriptase Drt4 n=1 Tax=Pseudomonas sp. SLFW TaxID=2683259 RepID=UPI001411CC23|nr:antiviral reverse transcriptase Drt4 [Pseudomonas sp. SLFW]NBB09527.1 hypothetical protein [Pseudomonas sp. SLFW]